YVVGIFFFSSRRRHTRFSRDWSSDVCSSDLFWGHGNTCSEGRIAVAVGEVTYSASESPTASTSRPKTCATYEAPEEGAAPASEHQTMPLAGELVVGQRYFIGCHYTDSPGELAYRDFFVYQPGEEGPVL